MSTHDWPFNIQLLATRGTVGTATISDFTLSEEQAKLHNLREALHYSNRRVHPGTYTRLNIKGQGLVMSSTPAEVGDAFGFMCDAHGRVLIMGLGLGVVVQGLMERSPSKWVKPVSHIMVVELNPDVISLVGPPLLERYAEQLTIIQADALEWNPRGITFDCAWFDIWQDICGDNKPEYMKLFRRWGRRVKMKQAWMKQVVYEDA